MSDPKNARNTDIWIAGAFAAFTVDLLVYPLDTIKTRLQSPDYKRLYTNGVDSRVSRSMFRGVYQGVGSVILATLPSCGSFFSFIPSSSRGMRDLLLVFRWLTEIAGMKQERFSRHTRASSQYWASEIRHMAMDICSHNR